MHASILFTVASLFLIGSYSLPQPMNLEATRSIKERGVHYEHGSHTMSAQAIQWCNDHPNVCSYYSSGSNSTTMVKRQAPQDHYQLPDGMTYVFLTYFLFLSFTNSCSIHNGTSSLITKYLDGRTSRSTGSRGIKGMMGTAAVPAAVPMARRRRRGSGESEGMLLLKLKTSIGERGRWERRDWSITNSTGAPGLKFV